MAVNFDVGSRAAASSPGTSRTWSHITGSTASVIVVEGWGPTLTNALYGGSTMTLIQSVFTDRFRQWYINNPAAGSTAITVNSSNSDSFVGGAISANGSAPTAAVIGSFVSTTSSPDVVTSINMTITTTVDSSLNVDMISTDGGNTHVTTGLNQLDRFKDETFVGLRGFGSSQTTAVIESYDMGWSWNEETAARGGIVELRVANPPPSAITEVPVMLFI